jgi:hypothetical protein
MIAETGLVTISSWVNNFLEDPPPSFGLTSLNSFADRDDPLLQKHGFRVEFRVDRPVAILRKRTMSYRVAYPLVVYRAAFIAAWLCTYCVPADQGQYIRPEVFIMAVKLAKGSRRAIGVTSLAFLYRSLDEAHHNIVTSATTATECTSFIPGHFIMGWFTSFFKNIEPSASLSCPIPRPPFVIDFRRRARMWLVDALNLFWEFDDSGEGLRSLDFIGRSAMRFPKSGKAVQIHDDRTGSPFHKEITIAAVDLLISCTVGGVTHRRGEHFDNRVYCPHRFARMFNYDQTIPDFIMPVGNDLNTSSLDFDSFLTNSREEALHILARRHLAFLRPEGHSLDIHPLSRRSKRTLGYILWCNKAFPFIQTPDTYCSRMEVPEPVHAGFTSAPGNVPIRFFCCMHTCSAWFLITYMLHVFLSH